MRGAISNKKKRGWGLRIMENQTENNGISYGNLRFRSG